MKPRPAPAFTTFRRNVRRWDVPLSVGIPFEMAQDTIRQDLNRAKHAVLESTWTDRRDVDFDLGGTGRIAIYARVITVRYVTGGMRHGLPASLDWDHAPGWVEFSRAHGLPALPVDQRNVHLVLGRDS